MIKEIKTPKIGLFFVVYNTESNKLDNCFRNELSINFNLQATNMGSIVGNSSIYSSKGMFWEASKPEKFSKALVSKDYLQSIGVD